VRLLPLRLSIFLWLTETRSQIDGGLGAWINFDPPQPIVPLERTVEASERVSITGEVVRALDKDAFRASLADLKRQKPEAISVSLLNSFSNDVHKKAIRDILIEEFGPEVEIVTSCDVLPEIQEYERTVTVTANAIVKPVVKKYMTGLSKLLSDDTDTIRILKSNGGLTSSDLAGELPVNILFSGPAGGTIGVSSVISHNTPFTNFITLDMGGTSTDCSIIPGADPAVRRETVVGGLTVRAPSIDVRTVAAGGGSIAHYNELTNSLRVGPESAGATPGPAAYGKGGKSATVTDANLTLGYLPTSLLGGTFKLDASAAADAVDAIAKQMGLSITDTAEGILNLANESMMGAIRNVSVEQGYDPRDFALVCFGGAGPLHANAVGKLLGSWPVIIPPSPGVLCAQGDVGTKMSHEQACTYIRMFSDVSASELKAEFHELETSCEKIVREALAGAGARLDVSYQLDMRYKGQALTLTVAMGREDLTDDTNAILETLRAKFAVVHEQQFSFSLPNIELEIMRLRVKITDASPEIKIKSVPEAETSSPPDSAIMSRSKIVCDGQAVEATFWDREMITKKGYRIEGPAVITEMDSNTLILPGYYGEIDSIGNILIRPTGATEHKKEFAASAEEARAIVADKPLIPGLVASALASIRQEMDKMVLRCAM